MPVVLHREIYALAAAAASALVIAAEVIGVDRGIAGTAAVAIAACLRIVAGHKRWNVPKI